MPATQKKNVDQSNTIEYQRTVINDMAGDLHSIFTGTAAINAATIQVAGADIGTISDHSLKTIFYYYGVFDADATISSPSKVAEVFSHEDATVDIEDTKTVTVDDGCALSITDTTKYEFFSNITEQTNPQKLVGFADNIKQGISADNTILSGKIKVGYVITPDHLKGTSKQVYTPTNASYTPTTGVLTLTIGTHAIEVGDSITIDPYSITFTCAQDSHATNHTYPRTTDPKYNKNITVDSVTSTTVTVNIGISPNTTAHTFVSASPSSIARKYIADDVTVDVDNTFTLTVDDQAVLII